MISQAPIPDQVPPPAAVRLPNKPVPTRIRVAPSAIASAKSPLIPIDSTSSFRRGCRRRPPVAPHPQTAKARPRNIFSRAPRRNRHQAPHFKVREIREPFQQLRSFVRLRLNSSLRLFRAQLHFDQHRQALANFPCRIVQSLRQPQRIQRINSIKDLCRLRRLIRLQMPNEMEAQSLPHRPGSCSPPRAKLSC